MQWRAIPRTAAARQRYSADTASTTPRCGSADLPLMQWARFDAACARIGRIPEGLRWLPPSNGGAFVGQGVRNLGRPSTCVGARALAWFRPRVDLEEPSEFGTSNRSAPDCS